ncbi:MAG: hypothetical protein KJ566_01830 [Nanoarchaeota archaeon]|nr:hypothetical protein [Nanoarchaeota archaeon]
MENVMMIETKINKKGAMALGQIMILLIGVIAISWAVGGGIGVVRAENKGGGDSTSYKSCSGTCRSSCLSGETTKTLVTGCLGSTPKCCISSGLTKKEPPAPGSGTPQQRESAPPEYDWGTYNYYADMDRDGVADTGVPNQYINNDDPNNPKIEPGFWDWATRIGGLAGTGTAIITFADKAGNKLGGEVGKETLKNMPKSDFLPNLKNWFLKGGKGLWQGAGTILMAWLAYALVKSVTASMMHERNANPINTAAFWTTIGVSGWGVAAMLGATGPPGWAAAAIVIIAALVTGIITGQRFSQETFSYIVSTWQPVDKGKWCEKCDELEYGCSEYQCKIFGKACGLLNPGTDYQKCYWKSEGDTTPPIILH